MYWDSTTYDQRVADINAFHQTVGHTDKVVVDRQEVVSVSNVRKINKLDYHFTASYTDANGVQQTAELVGSKSENSTTASFEELMPAPANGGSVELYCDPKQPEICYEKNDYLLLQKATIDNSFGTVVYVLLGIGSVLMLLFLSIARKAWIARKNEKKA